MITGSHCNRRSEVEDDEAEPPFELGATKPVAADERQRHPVQVTSNQARPLLRHPTEDTAWYHIAIMGGEHEDDGILAAGFIEAAGVLVGQWVGSRRDLLLVPILANYRHGIELALKNGIRTAASCAVRDGAVDPSLAAEPLSLSLGSTHSLGRLVEMLISVLGELRLGEGHQLPPETLEVLQGLHVLDESGQTFRYSVVKIGSGRARKLVAARPDQVQFDLPSVAAALDEAAAILVYGLSGVLEQYQQFQAATQEQLGNYQD